MSERVRVSEISTERLLDWLADCERDHATPIVLLAIGHDEQAGRQHIYRTLGAPSDAELGVLLLSAAAALLRSGAGSAQEPAR